MRRFTLAVAFLVSARVAAPGLARAGNADEPIDPDADAAVEPRLPTVQLVQAWPKTKQALLYDPIQGTYVVVAAGQNVDGFRVSRIGKNRIVLSSVGGAARDYVLLPTPVSDLPDAPGVPGTPATAGSPPAATATPAAPKPTPPDLLDPYPAGMLDPYGTEGVRVVDAPPQSKATGGPAPAPTGPAATTGPATTTGPTASTAGPVATTITPTGPAATKAPPSTGPTPAAIKTPPTTIPATMPTTTRPPSPPKVAAHPPTPAAHPPTPAAHTPTPPPAPPSPAIATTPPATAPATPAAAPPTAGTVSLSRKELDAALGDFGTLTKDTRLTLGPTGVAFAHVAPASLFAKIGLKDGDRVITVNGMPIHSLDDAANLYAQLGGWKQLALDVVRGAGHVTLRADLH